MAVVRSLISVSAMSLPVGMNPIDRVGGVADVAGRQAVVAAPGVERPSRRGPGQDIAHADGRYCA